MSSTKFVSYPKYISIRWILIVLRFTVVSSILVAPKILLSLDSAARNKSIEWDESILENESIHTKIHHINQSNSGSGSTLSNKRHRSLQKCVRNGRQLISVIGNIPNLMYTNIDICSKYISIDARVNNTTKEPQSINLRQKIVDFRCRLRKCILDAKSLSRHFYVYGSIITFQDIVFMNGNSFSDMNEKAFYDPIFVNDNATNDFYGGSLKLFQSTVTLIRCDMVNNTAKRGGGMHLWQSHMVLYGDNNASNPSLFEKNAAEQSSFECGHGGAIYADYFSSITTMEGYFLFRNNNADCDGGAIATFFESRVSVTNVVFQNNLAGGSGGAIVNEKSDSKLENVTLIENNAELGAALAHTGYQGSKMGLSLQMDNVTIANNTSNENGMVYIAGTRVEARNMSFSKSSKDADVYDMLLGNNLRFSTPDGVMEIYQQSGLNLPLSPPNRKQTRRDLEHDESLQQRLLKPCVFTFAFLRQQVNACDGTVVGISCIIHICAKVIRIPIESRTNSPIVSGLDLTNKNIKLLCRTTKRRCTLDGQGLSRIFYGGNASLTFRDIIFANGYDASSGGAVMMTAGSKVNFWNCSFYHNMASSGSAIAVYDNTALVLGGTRTKFLHNHGDTPPLFIYLSTLDLSDTFFDENKAAEYGGGGVLLFGSSINLFNVTFSNQSTKQSDDCPIFTASDTGNFLNSATCLNIY